MRKIKNPILISASVVSIAMVSLLTLSPVTFSASDKYQSMTQLQQATQEGKDWTIKTSKGTNDTLIVAPHGGGIEPGTSEIAYEIANKNNASYYTFKGIRPINNKELHVTSANYDEPKAQAMVHESKKTVTIHKTARSGNDIYVGGRDDALRERITTSLRSEGFDVTEAIGNIAGRNLNNITNQNQQKAGVQIELNNQFANQFFKNSDASRPSRENPANWTDRMSAFTDSINSALNES
ncbi:poly-gamma-glutamate hydrolase family protein [Staphylococcus simulans]|uniref:poly-gamma-glutamate hydrolase family protein n=1 Tax=Staphylococcus simulans TaxID=1286 RepID=UPI00280C0415|nr:poly-gamma-glutamate hydrolase family protein [Staphylococcus simulans]WMM10978.1 poly-gamma-glutamate hydrolase family protein [Staphylococcus simulans]